MRRTLYVTALVCGIGLQFLAGAGVANAEPTLQPRIQGSGFFVSANNNENVGYNCNISYTINYTEYGNSGSRSFQQTSYVAPKKSGDVLSFPTAWAADGLGYTDFKYSCFRAS